MYLKQLMHLDALIFFKVAMEYLTQQACRALYHHVRQNRGFVKHVVLGSQILRANYVQIQVTLLFRFCKSDSCFSRLVFVRYSAAEWIGFEEKCPWLN